MRRCRLFMILAVVAIASAADARERRPVDATPFAHAPCSVLDGRPCTPSTCSVFEHGPCIPEINYPIGQNLQVTVLAVPPDDQKDRYRKPDHDLDTLGDLSAALRSCWTPPAEQAARAGMQMSVMFAFNRAGNTIAPPRVTFASRDAPQQAWGNYLDAINSSLSVCLPLTLSKSLGGAIAGRPIMIRYVDNRP